MINVLAVREDALTISTQADTWQEAAERAIGWVDNQKKCTPGISKPIVRIFMSDGESGLEEHKISELREALKLGPETWVGT